MNLKKMYHTVICGMLALLIVTMVLLWNFYSLISQSRSLNHNGMQLITLSNDMLHVNNYLVKLMRLFMINHDTSILDEYNSILNDYESLNGKLDKMIEIGLTDDEAGQLDDLLALLDQLAEIEGLALEAFERGDIETADSIIYGDEYANADSILAEKTATLVSGITLRVNDGVADIQDQIQTRIIFIGAFLVLCISCFITLQIAQRKRVLKPIGEIQDILHKVSKGDIDIQLSKRHNDEIGSLFDDVNGMIDSINEQCRVLEKVAAGDLTVDIVSRSDKDVMNFAIIKMVNDLNMIFGAIAYSTTQVSSGSSQIANETQKLAHGAAEQISEIEELSISISAMSGQTQENMNMAGRAAALARTIKDDAQKSSVQMDRMMQAVNEINDASQSISRVIKVIDDIAFQTNILALNAAVEAARAGQHGKGFAVVAEEVRNLAAKSAAASKDTGLLIANSMEKAELGARIAKETAASLAGIVSGIGESNNIVAEIAASSEIQTTAITQINIGIQQVADIVQQSGAATEESAAASEEMSSQADILRAMVAQFKLKDPAGIDYNVPACSSVIQKDSETAFAPEYGAVNSISHFA